MSSIFSNTRLSFLAGDDEDAKVATSPAQTYLRPQEQQEPKTQSEETPSTLPPAPPPPPADGQPINILVDMKQDFENLVRGVASAVTLTTQHSLESIPNLNPRGGNSSFKFLRAVWWVGGISSIIAPILIRHWQFQAAKDQQPYYQYYNPWGGQGQDSYDPSTSTALKLVYSWQLILFIIILAFGYIQVLRHNTVTSHVSHLISTLVLWCQFSLMVMLLVQDGRSIHVSSGSPQYYQQFSVLLHMTEAWYAGFGFLFACVLWFWSRSSNVDQTAADQEQVGKKMMVEEGDYHAPYQGMKDVESQTNNRQDATGDYTGQLV